MDTMQWLPTKKAAEYLGVSSDTLHRYRDCRGGCLEAGRHYVFGPHQNSPITWDVLLCKATLHRRGVASRKFAAQVLEPACEKGLD